MARGDQPFRGDERTLSRRRCVWAGLTGISPNKAAQTAGREAVDGALGY